MITDVRHFQKYDYDIINCLLYWTESKLEHLLFVIQQTLNLYLLLTLVYTDFRLMQNTDVFGRLKWSWPERSGLLDNGIFVNNCLHFLVCIILLKQNITKSRKTDSEIKLLTIYFGKNHEVLNKAIMFFNNTAIFNNTARGKAYIIYALWFKQINKVERQMS